MHLPLSTGQAASLFGTTEAPLANLVRKGKVCPPPPVIAGRRLWQADHLIQAAKELDVLTDALRERIETAGTVGEVA